MNSVLNPEAPEFYPHLKSVTQDGYMSVTKTIKSSNHMPIGTSYRVFRTFSDFNVVTYQISENVIVQSNNIVVNDLPSVKFKAKDNENNTEKIIDANDYMLDRIHINIDGVCGVNTSANFLSNPSGKWNNAPVITKIQVGSTMFIGAKNIPRPQLFFKDPVDNSENLWVPKISDKPNNIKPLALNIIYNDEGEAVGYEHPYRMELDLYVPPFKFIDPDEEEPKMSPSLESTKLTYIDTESQVDALVEHLRQVDEIAVDVEHHSYRTYQGITCLIQISTEDGDFIIDALAVREHIHKLNLSFTDPKKLKVFHGAEMDVLWLQRDFGVYIVGMFDTHRAARALQLTALSLKYLLMKYCHVDTDKRYQLADWRIRPMPEELIEYARMDTHYLLYIWRRMKAELLEKAQGKPNLLLSVFEQSRQICGTTYNKTVITEDSHMPLYVRSKKSFDSRQMAALRLLYKWRDSQARELDESTSYLLPNHMLLALAEALPREVQGVNACCNPMPPFVKQNLITIHRMLLSCRELPLVPTLYQMPSTITSVLNTLQQPRHAHKVLDLSHFPTFRDEDVNLDAAEQVLEQQHDVQPDIPAFRNTCGSDLYGTVISDLNVNAELFIPPYDRYRTYRTIARADEIKKYKEQEAKITALGEGNELIKSEVLEKLQEVKAKTEKELGELAGTSEEASTSEVADTDTENPTTSAVEVKDEQKTVQRKRKMSTEKINKTKQATAETKQPTDGDKAKGTNKNDDSKNFVKPFPYKNANYKKFHNESHKAHKQQKMFSKKRK
ncbi:exosome component 10 isoform X2 [Zerene cesonia]|uniref:exosome component 10 isoform X2 n=1 Tax=Zerene cesonia TaxID=33412 RepID=UPI0018E56503|nr:exosome component 10 isoform X2 [Zerene cesonia]